MSTHPLQRRIRVEELVRRRAPEEGRRYAASQRSGRIDPNPHQLDAVVFALRRIPEGGCILADEVGLGKTIEAGLIISQLLAEGTRRVLLIVPKSLVGQWKVELLDLFGIDVREVGQDPEGLRGEGVFIVHREFAGGQKGAPFLWNADPFELVVIDEAHELFSGIHKRFDRKGDYKENANYAQTAARVLELVQRHGSPVLLLTATPIQNSLTELWSLVQYVERNDSLLGNLPTFRELFCENGGRAIDSDQAFDLRQRLGHVLQRTLRSQAQEFLEIPFVPRQARLVTYKMSPDERALYEDVSEWLLRPDLLAFSGTNGRLLLIGFLRRMASSLPAFTASLEKVQQRIEAMLDDGNGPSIESIVGSFEDDLEEDHETFVFDAESQQVDTSELPPRVRLRHELEELKRFIQRAKSLPLESKAQCLVQTVKDIQAVGNSESSSGKVVVFTESLTTQDHLVESLVEAGVPRGEITLFRGQNNGARAREAHDLWWDAVGSKMPPQSRPAPEVAMRLALVYEFQERSSVFISTEAGAKGLNLQFCERLINYDLPWNPQRIEQRIGRVHRYGQTRPVTVINFLASDNEAQSLLFEILSQKLELFGTVLDSSDSILHESNAASAESLVSAVGMDLERSLAGIWGGSGSLAEVTDRLRDLRSSLDDKRVAFDEEQARTAALIEGRLDENVRRIFNKYQDDLSNDLAALDRDLDEILCGYLTAVEVEFERITQPERTLYRIEANDTLPDGYREGARVCTGRPDEQGEWSAIHLGHPLVRAAVHEARQAMGANEVVRFEPSDNVWPESLQPMVGKSGSAVLVRVSYFGLEPVDHLLWVAVLEGEQEQLSGAVVKLLLKQSPTTANCDFDLPALDRGLLDDMVEECVMRDQADVARREEIRFESMMRQLDRYLADQVLVLKRRQNLCYLDIENRERRREKETSIERRKELERESMSLTEQAAKLDARIESLSAGDDNDYRKWVASLQDRRFKPPQVERLVQFPFIIGGQGGESC